MSTTIKVLFTFAITLIFILCAGCINIPGISSKNGADSLNAELYISSSLKTAIIVPLFGEVAENWAIDVEKALQNPQCSLVVLWIESPGGSVTETILLTHKLKAFQKKYNKQIYVYSERILASGAYWVASAFEKIIISPAGHTGSIGVYTVRTDCTNLYNRLGIKYYYIASDSAKIIGHDAIPMTTWERAHWQWSINATHAVFMRHIWSYRATQLIAAYEFRTMKAVKTQQDTLAVVQQFRLISNGILYNSRYAATAGLIDGIMYFDEFMKILQLDGYTTITAEGEVITEFYPVNEEENFKQKIKQKIWDHLQVEQR